MGVYTNWVRQNKMNPDGDAVLTNSAEQLAKPPQPLHNCHQPPQPPSSRFTI